MHCRSPRGSQLPREIHSYDQYFILPTRRTNWRFRQNPTVHNLVPTGSWQPINGLCNHTCRKSLNTVCVMVTEGRAPLPNKVAGWRHNNKCRSCCAPPRTETIFRCRQIGPSSAQTVRKACHARALIGAFIGSVGRKNMQDAAGFLLRFGHSSVWLHCCLIGHSCKEITYNCSCAPVDVYIIKHIYIESFSGIGLAGGRDCHLLKGRPRNWVTLPSSR